ncbi:hypothetical protein [Eubacterium ventriosum]|uniref:hypothetical protein n=1 Tax=Eubacterium ventriosum TaxID=39496 RepID=UPI003521A40F
MNISKRKQGILAIICTIAMIVTSITVYNPREVKADSSATVDGKQYSATVKDGGEWTGFVCQGIFDSARIHFAWGIDVDLNTITASIGETKLKVDGKAREMNIPLSEVTSLEAGSYDIVINATTVASESAEAKKISATATLKIEKVEGTTELQKPSAPTGLVANINNLKTDYTIAFANVATATSYKFYLDGTYKKDITNGGIVTIEELGLEAGKTYKFGVSAVNAAGESDITTIDVKVPGKEEETTTGSSTKPLGPSDIKDSEWTLALNSKTVSYYIADGKADKVSVKPQLEGDNYYIAFTLAAKFKSVTFDGVSKDVEDGAFCRVKVSDLTGGYHTLVVTDYYGKESVTIYFKVATKYTVSIDENSQTCEAGATIVLPANDQGYYDVTNKVAYAPETVLTVDEDMTLKSIELNVTMTPGASIRLAAPTGLRFQTTVTSGNGIDADEILNSKTVTTGTLITTLDLYRTNGKTLTKDSTYTVLDIANAGWFNDGKKTETGKFCGSIIKIQKENYGREFIAVGYATIKYSNGKTKTVYAKVTENNAKSIKYVAEKVQKSEAYNKYKDIIDKYINGEEISK